MGGEKQDQEKLLSRLKGNSLVSGASIYVGASALSAAIPFFLLPVLTRYLEPAEYGEVAVFHVWVALIGAVCGLSVHGAAARKYFDYEEPGGEMGEFIAACVMLLVISSLVVVIVVAPLAGLISRLIGLSSIWLLVGVLFAFCQFLTQLRLGQWQVENKASKYGIFQVFQSLINVLLSLALVTVFLLGADGRIAGYTISIVIFGILALYLLRKDKRLHFTWRPDYMREAIEFGVPLIPHIVGSFLLLTVDRAVISSVLGIDQAGYYMVAVQISMVLGLVLESVNRAFVPWLFERLKRNNWSEKIHIVKLTYAYYAVLLLIAALAFLIGKPVVLFVAGEKYAPSAEIVAWLVLAQSFRGMYFMVTNYIFYEKRTSVIALITITTGVLNIALMISLISRFGIIGAAWAFSFSMALQWLVTWYASSRMVCMPWIPRAKVAAR